MDKDEQEAKTQEDKTERVKKNGQRQNACEHNNVLPIFGFCLALRSWLQELGFEVQGPQLLMHSPLAFASTSSQSTDTPKTSIVCKTIGWPMPSIGTSSDQIRLSARLFM
eukprot:1009003-Amphidinium_carterae.1